LECEQGDGGGYDNIVNHKTTTTTTTATTTTTRTTRNRGYHNEEVTAAAQLDRVRRWEMWKDANAQLRQLRADLKCEADDVVRAEILIDIEGLKKRKGDMANSLGMTSDKIGDE